MNASRLGRIERIVLLASFSVVLAIGVIWFRSLVVTDKLEYTPRMSSTGTLESAEWTFLSSAGVVQIDRMRINEQSPLFRAFARGHAFDNGTQGWRFNATTTSGGDMSARFFSGLRDFRWKRWNDDADTGWSLTLPWAVPLILFLILPIIVFVRWLRCPRKIRRGFLVEPPC